jgi:hypothetical protein
MTAAATHNDQSPTTAATLFVAFELSEKTWKLGFTTGHGQKPRERTITAQQQERILDEIAQAKRRLGLPDTAPVVSCYEAGREGFWLHRCLQGHGITNHVVDSSSIEVNRRRRRAKSDGLDVRKLLGFDHGVGHPLLFLCDEKAPNCRNNKCLKDLYRYSEWPKVADAVIKASC